MTHDTTDDDREHTVHVGLRLRDSAMSRDTSHLSLSLTSASSCQQCHYMTLVLIPQPTPHVLLGLIIEAVLFSATLNLHDDWTMREWKVRHQSGNSGQCRSIICGAMHILFTGRVSSVPMFLAFPQCETVQSIEWWYAGVSAWSDSGVVSLRSSLCGRASSNVHEIFISISMYLFKEKNII